MDKKILISLSAIVMVMLILPWMAVRFVRSGGGMAICFILFFAINPLFSIVLGRISGKARKKMWYFPVLSAMIFLLSYWILFGMGESAFIIYAGAYLLLGVISMLITAVN